MISTTTTTTVLLPVTMMLSVLSPLAMISNSEINRYHRFYQGNDKSRPVVCVCVVSTLKYAHTEKEGGGGGMGVYCNIEVC